MKAEDQLLQVLAARIWKAQVDFENPMLLKVLGSTAHMMPLFCVRKVGCCQLRYREWHHHSNRSRFMAALTTRGPRKAREGPCWVGRILYVGRSVQAAAQPGTLWANVPILELHNHWARTGVQYSLEVGISNIQRPFHHFYPHSDQCGGVAESAGRGEAV